MKQVSKMIYVTEEIHDRLTSIKNSGTFKRYNDVVEFLIRVGKYE